MMGLEIDMDEQMEKPRWRKNVYHLQGQKFGMLTVIDRVKTGRYSFWKCRCDCGAERNFTSYMLVSGNNKSCGCLITTKSDLSGMKFGMVSVLSRHPNRKRDGRTLWDCQCDCGTTFLSTSKNLQRGATKHCGCMIEESRKRASLAHRKSPLHRLIHEKYDDYKQSAKRRKIEFTLPKDNFGKLLLMDCFYCGFPPRKEFIFCGEQSGLRWNGIDRSNNKEGYTIENVVTCCFECNVRKSDTDFLEFTGWAIRVSENLLKEDEEEYLDAIRGDAVRQYLLSQGRMDDADLYKTPTELYVEASTAIVYNTALENV